VFLDEQFGQAEAHAAEAITRLRYGGER